MSLEIKLKALELSMKGRLDEITDDIIDVDGVQELLTTYFAERDTRPELVNQIKSWSIMYDYLELELEEREEFEQFRKKHPKYLEGTVKRKEKERLPIKSRNVERLVRKQRLTNQLLIMFDFYLVNRKDFEVFNITNVDPLFKARFGNLGKSLDNFFRRRFAKEGGFDYFVRLALEQRPEITQYTDPKEVLKIDGVRKLCEIFDFYLEHREDFQVFTFNMISEHPLFKAKFGNLGNLILDNFQKNFKERGGTDYLIGLATEKRPEIRRYIDQKEILKIDGTKMLTDVFDFYLEHREDFQVFDSNYIRRNNLTRAKFPKLSESNLYYRFWRNFEEEGRFDYFVGLVSEQRPEIKRYNDPNEVLKIDGTRHMIRVFDFYLQNRECLQTFNANYISNNPLFKTKFGKIPDKVIGGFKRNFGDDQGFDYLIELISQERPNIRTYVDQKKLLRQEGPAVLLELFDFYLLNRDMENGKGGAKFNTNSICKNDRIINNFGDLGSRLVSKADYSFSQEGGIDYLVQLASQQRPEILEYWRIKA